MAAASYQGVAQAHPLVALGWSGKVRAIFIFQEEVRPEAKDAIAALRAMGLDLKVLTGDHAGRGQALEKELGVSVLAELLPEDKVAAVVKAHEQFGSVAMVGDGINDAPALARGDVGIAMGCGADFTRASAGVCLLGNDLRRLPWSIALARRTVRVIRQNQLGEARQTLAAERARRADRTGRPHAATADIVPATPANGDTAGRPRPCSPPHRLRKSRRLRLRENRVEMLGLEADAGARRKRTATRGDVGAGVMGLDRA